ncbi:olfactory receptor 5V1-like [Lissotriton helveticus]
MENASTVTNFFMVGFSNDSQLRHLLFSVFILIYITTLLGNFTIMFLITVDAQLHTPMYFFLANLSFLDIACVSTTVLKMLDNLLAERKPISFHACIIQMSLFQMFIIAECFLLAAMSYDRYLAICHPLNYTLLMSQKVQLHLLSGCWIVGGLNSVIETVLISSVNFCGPNLIDHFFCDSPALLKLSCSNTSVHKLVIFVVGFFVGLLPFLIVFVSYIPIVSAIFNIHSTQGRQKTFATCASHLVVVTLFYGTGMFTYIIQPTVPHLMDDSKIVTVVYTILTPMLNPFIYSLRNNQVKSALWRVMGKNTLSA